ncbi:phosphoglucose isomerase [Campylobacter pinnipediorum subsp. caledonicus]|uniref:Glucose-6-phosphate isomerase n=1 Tax=Campylobacter pinnipediorum subsp. caledonicus TaxID=1874362 RepID=A0A1S6U8V3_9BACT|nr:glucose-6-phosphate isomerase [Campylobacter pinnipediorum]AQW88115.1 phosphoglucose isomerase [Campylobacter pinnipediorum subsp. caledonicus]OPA71557.1 glucose-6-phosphate isomerase [Campylobacter pinnipediorum subsp. caledonicus]
MIKNSFYFNFDDENIINEYAKRVNLEHDSGEIGYYHLPDLNKKELDKILEYEKNLKGIKNIVLVGIGGSSLGVKALKMAMAQKQHTRELFFIDNVDPSVFEMVNKHINFEESLFIISSKSGNTIETISIFKCLIDIYKPADLSRNFLIITDENTTLEQYAKENNINFFNIPKNVGGRFSVLSVIGLVPLAFCGYDISLLLDGAMYCKKQYIDENDNSIISKAYHYATHRNADINVVFSYSSLLDGFNDWYVQLWAESLGKKNGYKRIGRTPVGLIGSKDQHSFLQLIMDGVKDKTITFIKVKNTNSVKIPSLNISHFKDCDFVDGLQLGELINFQCDSTKMALVQEGLSVDVIELDMIDEWHMGYLVYYYELLTSATGIMLGIDTYNQPGVEIGKRILKNMLLK